jgi:hypothetical protein
VALLSDLISRTRLELADQPKQFTKDFAGDGLTTSFTLGVKPVDVSSLYVTVNGSPVAYPSGYTVEADFGAIHFTTAPALNTLITVTGSVFRYFTDEELATFVNTSLLQHTYNKTDSFGSSISVSNLNPIEEYPVVILSTVEALWALATDASYDIDIVAPDGVHIPRSERYRQMSTLIQARMAQYTDLCKQLNIGLFRIEMGTLRRVSRTTNKLVPIYIAQEIDDARRPERVYMQNDLLGRTAIPSTAQIYDMVIYQGDSFSTEFDFPFDTSTLAFKAQIRTYPNAPSLYATFTVTVISQTSTLSRIRLSLTKQETAYLPVRAFWDLQATAPADPNYELTYIRGQVFVDQQVTLD